MKAKLHYVLSIAIFLFVFSVVAQNSTWKKIEVTDKQEDLSKLNLGHDNVHLFKLDAPLLKKNISSVPLRGSSKKTSNKIINIPALNGDFESFLIYEAPVFAPELAAKYPNIKSYVGISTKDSKTRLRMSVSPQGVQTMISYIGKPTVFMQPVKKGYDKYVLYEKSNKNPKTNGFECKTIDKLNGNLADKSNKSSKVNEGGANNQTLQKFRIAVSVTGEYTAYHGGTVAGALAGINASLTRVNQVFETDMAVTFELIANNDLVIYTDASTDPYSDATNIDNWNSELQNNLTATIGESNYDIGHLFGASGGGGNAGCIGCVCVDGSKGSAYTSPSNNQPEGDTFDIDFVAHEIGHQMGANHTWAFDSEGTGVNSEPGSGSTVMAYAGLQGADNVVLMSDDYFHFHSIKQILDNLVAKSCQITEAITNNPPSANAGNDYNIPKGTAYVLKGAATDSDGSDNLTYCWEQIDSGVTNYLNFGPTLLTGSMNRSLPPTNSPDRFIPKLSSVLAGQTTQTNPSLGSDWETVATVARTLNWALTVRDRTPSNASGGQTSYDTMQITVEDVTPFTVSNPVSWAQGSNQTIEWVVGQTNNATINCQNVNIKLSTDGGITFPIIIASNTENDGSFDYTVPAIADTENARLLIEAADNIFYDVSNFDFSISSNPNFFIVNETLAPIACAETTATFTFDYVAANGFAETTTFSASGNPSGSTVTFSPTSLSAAGSVTMAISNLENIAQGDYSMVITGTSTSITKNKNIDFPFYNGHCLSIANTVFHTSTTLVNFNTINQVSAKPSGYSDYTNISTDVNVNEDYELTVNANTDGDYTTSTLVWIDWNQNCSFNDAGEQYNLGTATNTNGATSNAPLTITIPGNAALGQTIMRVATKFLGDGLPTSCENGFDGEVEDYSINVLPQSTSFETQINLVKFNAIDQASNKPAAYTDYSSVVADVQRDSSHELTVNVSTERNFTTATKAWVDWDQNGSFTDPGEEYNLGEATNATNSTTSNSPLSITVPVDAVLGNTIMRLATKYIGGSGDQSPSSVENGSDGEVEDYTLNIKPTEAIEEFGFENLLVFPNSNNGTFTIKLNGSLTRDITVEMFDIRNRLVFNKTFKATGDLKEKIVLNFSQSGMYILSVSDGLRKSTKKIIVE